MKETKCQKYKCTDYPEIIFRNASTWFDIKYLYISRRMYAVYVKWQIQNGNKIIMFTFNTKKKWIVKTWCLSIVRISTCEHSHHHPKMYRCEAINDYISRFRQSGGNDNSRINFAHKKNIGNFCCFM